LLLPYLLLFDYDEVTPVTLSDMEGLTFIDRCEIGLKNTFQVRARVLRNGARYTAAVHNVISSET
jgi:hypothetical protein